MNFAEALQIDVDKIEKPPLTPTGHYRWKITKYVFGDVKSAKGEWDKVDFNLKAVDALDDVDPTDLAKVGGTNMVGSRLTFMFDKDEGDEGVANAKRTLYNLKRFLTEHCGIEGNSLRELIDNSKGAEFMANIRHREDPNNKGTYFAEIDRTAPVK